ncbi:sulfotransferase ssu-1-like [Amblyomma americanum]
MASEAFRYIDGLHICKHFPEDAVRSTLAYKPQPGDLFIVTYPKCGTSWMQQIVYNILMNGDLPEDKTDAILRLPFLEIQGADAATYGLKPGAYKTHLPFHMHPYSPDAKYIYVVRNPYDCCVSFYHHTRNFPMYHFENGTFDEFVDKFVAGKVDFGDYCDHLLSWYEHRNDANVLFLTFEDIKRDTKTAVLRVAEFMGKNYGSKLREDQALLEKIVKAVSFENMKDALNAKFDAKRSRGDNGGPNSSGSVNTPSKKEWNSAQLKGLEAFKTYFAKPMKGDFARKGAVGDWKQAFNSEQIAKMKRYIAWKTAGSDVMNLWKDIPIEYDTRC